MPPDQIAAIERFNDEGKSVAMLVVDKQAVGAIAMRGEPRADAIAGIAELKQSGVASIMLTGDNRRPAEAVAKSLGKEGVPGCCRSIS